MSKSKAESKIKSKAQFKKFQRMYMSREISHEDFLAAKEDLDLDSLPDHVADKPPRKRAEKKKERTKKSPAGASAG